MRKLIQLFIFLTVVSISAQETPNFAAVDSLYREDQFYFAFTYNILQNRPTDLKQNKFSSGITAGFLRDMPFNKSRTWSIAAGVGYTINNYNMNLAITEQGDEHIYSILDSDIPNDKNKLILHYVDIPIEIRWRTSTPESHKFWRIYTGLKFSYLILDRYKFDGSGTKFANSSNPDLNRIQYGTYVAVGYNTWNLNVYYGLNPLFKSAELESGETIDMHTLNIGLMFYIL